MTIKTGLQDYRVGIECSKCAVDFFFKLPNSSDRPNIFRKRIPQQGTAIAKGTFQIVSTLYAAWASLTYGKNHASHSLCLAQ